MLFLLALAAATVLLFFRQPSGISGWMMDGWMDGWMEIDNHASLDEGVKYDDVHLGLGA